MDKRTYECPSPPDDYYHWEEKSWVTPGLAGAVLPSASGHSGRLDPITMYLCKAILRCWSVIIKLLKFLGWLFFTL